MLAKGHHFPKVTLVAILNADSGLFSADFRGMERTAQQILQVAGRAGRAELPGKVVMQTHHADHPTINSLINDGYLAFAQQELNTRNSANLPPTINCIMLRAEARYQGQAERFLMQVRQQFDRQDGKPQWIGPLPSPMEKRAGIISRPAALTKPRPQNPARAGQPYRHPARSLTGSPKNTLVN